MRLKAFEIGLVLIALLAMVWRGDSFSLTQFGFILQLSPFTCSSRYRSQV